MRSFTKQILLAAVLIFAALGAKAQNKVFEKYFDMKGVESVTIGKSMIADAIDANLAKRFDKLYVINFTSKDAKKKIAADIKALSNNKDYEVLMSGSEGSSRYDFLFNAKSSPTEFIISASDGKEHIVMLFLGDFTEDDLESLVNLMDDFDE